MEVTDNGTYKLSSGFEFNANGLIIGLSPGSTIIYHGYDGLVYDVNNPISHLELNPIDAIEVGKYMIDQWSKFVKHQEARIS